MSLRTLLPRAVFLALAAAVILPVPGSAQVPGGELGDAFSRRDAERAAFRARILGHVSETLAEWKQAWAADEKEELIDAYAAGATVRGLPFGFSAGEDALEEAFAAFLPDAGEIQLDLREFNASGRLAYGVGDFRFRTGAAGGSRSTVRGTVMTVFLKESGWKILSQLFVPGAGGSGSG